jgi:UDP-N-acetylmuramyl pentapeptide phosphotransferase/UDP-N-acetylglucosamine-1-phosphate transferase
VSELSLAFLIALVASLAFCAIVRRAAPAMGAVVPPRADRWHSAPTPTMGGMAVAGASLLAFGVFVGIVSREMPTAWLSVPGAAVAMFVVGTSTTACSRRR